MNIAVIGCGGIGGYYGGKLAAFYRNDPAFKICFKARGEHLRAICENGLKISSPGAEIIAQPFLASNDANDFPLPDLVLVCVKTYSIAEACDEIRPLIRAGTILLPLVNGIETYTRLQKEFPQAHVFDGCCYLNSYVASPGAIKFLGGFEQVLIGYEEDAERNKVASVLKAASLDVYNAKDIENKKWAKFIFGSVFSAIGSLYNENFGELAMNPERMDLARTLLAEIIGLAKAKEIHFPGTFAEETLQKFRSFSPEARTSMQQDLAAGKNTEVESFIGYVVREAEKFKTEVPEYKKLYAILSARKPL